MICFAAERDSPCNPHAFGDVLETGPLLHIFRNVGALAVQSIDQIVLDEKIDCFARRNSRYAEHLTDFFFGSDFFAGRELSAVDPFSKRAVYADVAGHCGSGVGFSAGILWHDCALWVLNVEGHDIMTS